MSRQYAEQGNGKSSGMPNLRFNINPTRVSARSPVNTSTHPRKGAAAERCRNNKQAGPGRCPVGLGPKANRTGQHLAEGAPRREAPSLTSPALWSSPHLTCTLESWGEGW